METEKKIVGRCPLCGANVVKTCKGYRCENNIDDTPKCSLYLNGVIGNRKMTDEEISMLLERREIMLDGFATKEWKSFPTVLSLKDDGTLDMNSIIGKCPRCGGDIRVGAKAFNCSNYKNADNPCEFVIWRNIGGHLLTLDEVRQICANGQTTEPVAMFREDGFKFNKKLGLSPDKTQIVKI